MSPTPKPTGAPAAPPDGVRTGARTGERIAKLLARAGIASRREVERLIAEGRVRIGDEVVTTPATVLENLKGVSVDGVPVKAAEPARLFAFHKPSGLITAERDPTGRPTIYTALRNALPPGTPRLMPVGRLDLNTEGLLLLTNDGELKRAMELPSSGIPRTYRARTFGDITQAQLEELIEGVTIDGMHYGKIDANMERRTGRNQWIEMTLTEGKNREVRRVLEHLGLQVSRLLRISYGPFILADLPRGMAGEIRQVDVERFRKSLGNPGATPLAPVAAPNVPQRPVAERPALERAPAERSAAGRTDYGRPGPGRPASGRAAPPAEGRGERKPAPRKRLDEGLETKPWRLGEKKPGESRQSKRAPAKSAAPRGRSEGERRTAPGAPGGDRHPSSSASKPGASKPGGGKPYGGKPSDGKRPGGGSGSGPRGTSGGGRRGRP